MSKRLGVMYVNMEDEQSSAVLALLVLDATKQKQRNGLASDCVVFSWHYHNTSSGVFSTSSYGSRAEDASAAK